MGTRHLLRTAAWRFDALAGVGGIGTGLFFALEGDRTLGRNESRPGRLLDWRDYCKLHIIAHHAAVLTGARPGGHPFHVLPVGRVGDDEAGIRLKAEMAQAGMDVRFVESVPGEPTLLSICFQYPDGAGGNITTSNAASGRLDAGDIDRAADVLARHGDRAIALAAPEVPLALRRRLLERATSTGALRVAAIASAEVPEALETGLLDFVDLLALNEDEAAAVAGAPFDPAVPGACLARLAAVLHTAQPGMRVSVTAGAHGAWGCDGTRWVHCPAAAVRPVSTAGAGDAFLGALLAALSAGLPFLPSAPPAPAGLFDSALEFGSLAAGMSVTSPHTIHPGLHLDAVLDMAASLGMRPGPHVARLCGC